MRTDTEIQHRIAQVSQKLRQIEEAKAAELQKPFFQRNGQAFYLYQFQERIHRAVLNELEWLQME